jgi:hypothetical protein
MSDIGWGYGSGTKFYCQFEDSFIALYTEPFMRILVGDREYYVGFGTTTTDKQPGMEPCRTMARQAGDQEGSGFTPEDSRVVRETWNKAILSLRDIRPPPDHPDLRTVLTAIETGEIILSRAGI